MSSCENPPCEQVGPFRYCPIKGCGWIEKSEGTKDTDPTLLVIGDGEKYRAQCDCGWSGSGWFSAHNAERERIIHLRDAHPLLSDELGKGSEAEGREMTDD